jgi:hypothetical protein
MNLKDSPVAYSAFVQFWLAVPAKGVFVDDFGANRPGRPSTYELGRKAERLHKKGLGYVRLAKTLIPEAYAKNRDTAVKRVRDAMRTYNARQAKPDVMYDIFELVNKMMGIVEKAEDEE